MFKTLEGIRARPYPTINSYFGQCRSGGKPLWISKPSFSTTNFKGNCLIGCLYEEFYFSSATYQWYFRGCGRTRDVTRSSCVWRVVAVLAARRVVWCKTLLRFRCSGIGPWLCNFVRASGVFSLSKALRWALIVHVSTIGWLWAVLHFSQSPDRARVNRSRLSYSGQRRCDNSAGQSLHTEVVTRQSLAVQMISESRNVEWCFQTSSVDCFKIRTSDTTNGTVGCITGS